MTNEKNTVCISLANESNAYHKTEKERFEDKSIFVTNLGILLQQANTDVISAELIDNNTVLIQYIGGGTRWINIAADSYTAIIKDVVKNIM